MSFFGKSPRRKKTKVTAKKMTRMKDEDTDDGYSE
jgi:hypothetical protein